jgi:hypothetical protein
MSKLNEVNLEKNAGLTPDGWGAVLSSFRHSSTREFGDVFSWMTDEKASAVAKALSKQPIQYGLRRAIFSGSKQVQPSTWKELFDALDRRSVEEVRLDQCELDDAKAASIASALRNMRISELRDIILISEQETKKLTLLVKVLSAKGLTKNPKLIPEFVCACRVRKTLAFRTTASYGNKNPTWGEEYKVEDYSEDDELEFFIADESYAHRRDSTAEERRANSTIGRGVLHADDFYEKAKYPNSYDGELVIQLPVAANAKRISLAGTKYASATTASLKLRIQVLPKSHINASGLQKLLQALRGAQVQDLGGIFEGMDELKARYVADTLSSLKALQRFDCSNSWHVSAEIWGRIIHSLRHCRDMRYLILRRCRLDEKKVTAIAENLQKLRSLHKVDFGWNREVSGHGWKKILVALRHAEIQELSFEHCQLTDSKAELIAEALPALRKSLIKEKFYIHSGNFQLTEHGKTLIEEAFDKSPDISDSSSRSPSAFVHMASQDSLLDLGEIVKESGPDTRFSQHHIC